jgi:hypothetical protein
VPRPLDAGAASTGIDVANISHVINFALPGAAGRLRAPYGPPRACWRERRCHLVLRCCGAWRAALERGMTGVSINIAVRSPPAQLQTRGGNHCPPTALPALSTSRRRISHGESVTSTARSQMTGTIVRVTT